MTSTTRKEAKEILISVRLLAMGHNVQSLERSGWTTRRASEVLDAVQEWAYGGHLMFRNKDRPEGRRWTTEGWNEHDEVTWICNQDIRPLSPIRTGGLCEPIPFGNQAL